MCHKIIIGILLFIFPMISLHATPDAPPKTLAEITTLVQQYCGACHNTPPPTLLPKKDWPYVVKNMAELAARQTGEIFISDEHVRDISAYYYGSSPEKLELLPYSQNTNSPKAFITSTLAKKAEMPLVINIKAVELEGDNTPEFLVCDGERNQVSLLTLKNNIWQERVLAEVTLPSHTEVVDYDLDGDKDIIVAVLGQLFSPPDLQAGKILLLRQTTKGVFEKEVLLEGIGRITDARAVDIDGDKDIDLAISVFGSESVGEIAWLENQGKGKHVKHTLLNHSGGLNIIPSDLNGDGKLDLISLISQELEAVVAFINQGNGKFKSGLLFKAGHPMVGFTSMSMADLDGDNDLGILLTNGDANDLQHDPKPYHGVLWLENKGELQFKYHGIARFYGTAIAKAGDMDADGDMDIVVGSWSNYWEDPKRQTLVWFENNGKQHFTRHNIISRPKSIVTLALEDITGDNNLDIIAGIFRIDLLISSIKARQNNEKNEKGGENKEKQANKTFEEAEEPLLKDRIILLKTVNKIDN